MPTKQELRSEETKRSVLEAAGKLFGERGFDAVTMREIAKEAGCSHTTIYIYFKDKEALLHQLSMSPIQELKQHVEAILTEPAVVPEVKLKAISQAIIRFCLTNRNMYAIFFTVKSVRVDEAEPLTELNRTRNGLFALLQKAVQQCLPTPHSVEQLLAYSRIYFYTLQGMVATYTNSEETVEALMDRLGTTFNEAIEVLLIGFTHKLKQGADRQ
jgi:AcrR family transcriptional regulator